MPRVKENLIKDSSEWWSGISNFNIDEIENTITQIRNIIVDRNNSAKNKGIILIDKIDIYFINELKEICKNYLFLKRNQKSQATLHEIRIALEKLDKKILSMKKRKKMIFSIDFNLSSAIEVENYLNFLNEFPNKEYFELLRIVNHYGDSTKSFIQTEVFEYFNDIHKSNPEILSSSNLLKIISRPIDVICIDGYLRKKIIEKYLFEKNKIGRPEEYKEEFAYKVGKVLQKIGVVLTASQPQNTTKKGDYLSGGVFYAILKYLINNMGEEISDYKKLMEFAIQDKKQ